MDSQDIYSPKVVVPVLQEVRETLDEIPFPKKYMHTRENHFCMYNLTIPTTSSYESKDFVNSLIVQVDKMNQNLKDNYDGLAVEIEVDKQM
ncbi:unnamed protein product [Trichobilharzia regenti]|nr:unnamed protein product [Trichobilharzia regenti]